MKNSRRINALSMTFFVATMVLVGTLTLSKTNNLTTEKISFSNVVASVDSYEDNDDFASASSITPGSYSNLDIGDDDKYDYYKIDVDSGKMIVVVVNYDNVHNPYDIDIFMYDSAHSSLYGYSNWFDTGIKFILTDTDYSGTYYIEVYGY
ncbi:MAG: hypothetical protein ACTSRA_15100, partial [Promethearchaeota archaeon]